MTSDFSVKGIFTLAPQGGLFPFSSSCSQGDPLKPRALRARFPTLLPKCIQWLR